MELRDTDHYIRERTRAYELYAKHARGGILDLLSLYEGIAFVEGDDANWYMVNRWGGKTVPLFRISSRQEAERLADLLARRRAALAKELSNDGKEDFPGEYDREYPPARPMIFQGQYPIVGPIDPGLRGTEGGWQF